MDKLDIGILRELLVDESTLTLQADVRRPYMDISRKLRVTDETVRSRIQKMQELGLIRGWRLGLNPTLFGYQTEYIWVDVNLPSTKEEVLRMARRIPRVIGIQNYFDNFVGISLAYSGREELDKEIIRVRRVANSQNILATKTPFLLCKLRLADTDWRIVRSIRRDPRKPYGEIAAELGLSRRTVKRRAEKMMSAHAWFILPELDLRKLDAGMLATLSVFHPPEFKSEIDRRIFAKYGESLVITHSTAPEYGWFAFIVPNPSAAKEIQTWASSLQGVKMANVRVIEEFINLLGGAFEPELQQKTLSVLADGQTNLPD